MLGQDDPCYNSDFEEGDLTGWNGLTGEIDSAGNIILDPASTFSYPNHTIKWNTSELDPIALNCGIEVPVVAPGGNYSLKLGDAWGGSNAEAVEKTVTVGPENTYFNLRYAVILEDPDHEPHEQPRFKIDITDENGDLSTCGSYLVVADESIEGFENCGDWRIKNWTTVTLELWSYLGQTITIRFTTSDCSQGAHAGYAYVDGYCGALDIETDAYCEGSTQVEFNTVPGLLSYEWSNGDTSYNTTINDPVPGDIYCVYVNGVTDCPVTICDTVPEISPVPELLFDLLNDTVVCDGSIMQLELQGENIVDAFWDDNPEGGSILQTTPINSDFYAYTVIGVDDCYEIRDSVYVGISQAPVFNPTQADFSICPGDSITLNVYTVNNNDEVQWLPGGELGNSITVSPNEDSYYTALVSDQWSCFQDSLNFTVEVIELPVISIMQSQESVCSGEVVYFQVDSESSDSLIYDWSGLGSDSDLWLTADEDTEISLTVSTSEGCQLQPIDIDLEVLPIQAAVYQAQADPICMGDSANLIVEGSNYSEIIWSWNEQYITADSISVLCNQSTFISFEIVSTNACVSIFDSIWLQVNPQPAYQFDDELIACSGDSVLLQVQLSAGTSLEWDDFNSMASEQWVMAIENESFQFTITDENDCAVIEESIELIIPDVPEFSVSTSDDNVCQGSSIQLETDLPNGVTYQWFDQNGAAINEMLIADSTAEFCAIAYNAYNCPGPPQCINLTVAPSAAIIYETEELPICAGETAELSIVGDDFVLLWLNEDDNGSNNSNPAIFTPDSSQYFNFQLADNFQCNTLNDSIWVEVVYPAEYETSALQQDACYGESITLSINTDSENQVYWLYQDTTAHQITIEATSDLDIWVEISDPMFCETFTELFEINLHEISPLTVSASGQQICQSDSITLFAESNSGTTVYWEELGLPGNELSFVPDSSMTIHVSGIDENGCETSPAEIFVEVMPHLVMIPDNLEAQICAGDSLMLNIEGENIGSVYWMDAAVEGPMMMSPEESTFLSVMLTDINDCSIMEVEYYVEVMQPQEIQLSGLSLPTCEGSMIELEVMNPDLFDTYIWMDESSGNSNYEFLLEDDMNFTMEAIDLFGCKSPPLEIEIEMIELPEPEWLVEEASVCAGDSIELLLSVDAGVSVFWPDLGVEGLSVWVKPEESRTYVFELIDEFGCESIPQEIFVEVLPLPEIELGEDRCITEEIILDASFPEATYNWNTGETSAEIVVTRSGLYEVELETKCGKLSDAIFIELRNSVCFIKPPSAFSPNGDGLNDLFKPISNCTKDDYIDYRFTIHSRWGQVLFESDDLNIGWDGTFLGKKMEIGVFVWYLQYEDQLCGTSVQEKGNVTIVR